MLIVKCIHNFRGAYSFFEMLKGYMLRERLGSPVLGYADGNDSV